MSKGLSASRWASDMPNVTSWPRPAPTPTPHLPTTHNEQQLKKISPFASPRPRVTNNSPTNNNNNNSHNEKPTSPEQQLSRFLKIVARLKWKIPFLELGYQTALDRVGKAPQDANADEIHFKLDFHEFYMLIERALVHLMGVYGITVRGGPSAAANSAVVAVTTASASARRGSSLLPAHSYHEDVLLALDDASNPLHSILGRPAVRRQFARAKHLRNQWKHANEDLLRAEAEADAVTNAGLGSSRFAPAPLASYHLKETLQDILRALDEAYTAAEAFVRRGGQPPPASPGVGVDVDVDVGAGRGLPVSRADWTTDSNDWEFMVDAMDWEGV